MNDPTTCCDIFCNGCSYRSCECVCSREMTLAVALDWTKDCDPGDRLTDHDDIDQNNSDSRCGFSDGEIATINARLRARGLSLLADHKALVVRKVAD